VLRARATARASRLRNIEKSRARNREYMRDNRDKAREWNRRDREAHPERVRLYLKKYYALNGEKIRGRMRDRRTEYPEIEAGRQLRKRYGIGIEDYGNLLAEQSGNCAICRRAGPGVSGRQRLFVDHDHRTLIVRGLLCYRCNTGCGNFKDSAKVLLAAARYLERSAIARRKKLG
jgi:hypothetical protein